MNTVALISKPSKQEIRGILQDLIAWFADRDYVVLMDEETAVYGSNEHVYPRDQLAEKKPDFVVVLGGDGTLLSAARAVSRTGIPLLAVNLGSLGFLTEVPLSQMYETLQQVHECRCPVEGRAVLECELFREGRSVGKFYALNEATVAKAAIARLVALELKINDEFVYASKADGVIVATPTGSTAYSLSAGGPVMMPHAHTFIITPICPHSFTQRPLVVPDNACVEITVESTGEAAFLSIDGQVGEPLNHGDRVVCRKADFEVKLLRSRTTFFEVLRNKLKWGER